MLVAAVLRPEQGEDRELEVVRLPPEQGDDTVELLVREAERAVDRLSDGGAQATIVAAGPGGITSIRAALYIHMTSRDDDLPRFT